MRQVQFVILCFFFLLLLVLFPKSKPLQLHHNRHALARATSVSHPHQGSTIYQMLIRSYGYFYLFYYLQVYSHDTGRVKIKISETAKPKTPILVTRAPSNVGDDKYVNQINQQ